MVSFLVPFEKERSTNLSLKGFREHHVIIDGLDSSNKKLLYSMFIAFIADEKSEKIKSCCNRKSNKLAAL